MKVQTKLQAAYVEELAVPHFAPTTTTLCVPCRLAALLFVTKTTSTASMNIVDIAEQSFSTRQEIKCASKSPRKMIRYQKLLHVLPMLIARTSLPVQTANAADKKMTSPLFVKKPVLNAMA